VVWCDLAHALHVPRCLGPVHGRKALAPPVLGGVLLIPDIEPVDDLAHGGLEHYGRVRAVEDLQSGVHGACVCKVFSWPVRAEFVAVEYTTR
jgi:hypothetical protein